MEFKVIKKEFQEFDKLIFAGSKKDCKFIYSFFKEYYKYDKRVDVSIVEIEPEYKTVEEFKEEWKYEIKAYENELRNKK